MTRLRRIADRDRVFFVTTNLRRGVPALSPPERDVLLKQVARQRGAGDLFLFAYVFMPSHLHLLLAPRRSGLIAVMREFKSRTAQQIAAMRGINRATWQPRYFDFVLRRAGDFWDKLEYIHQNPVAAGLSTSAECWSWSSAGHYSKTSNVPVPIDAIDLPSDRNSWLRV